MKLIEFTRNGKREVALVLGNAAMWAEQSALGRVANCAAPVRELKDVRVIRE